jgi:hypothetical protein
MLRSFGKKEVYESQVGAHGAGAAAFGDDLHDFLLLNLMTPVCDELIE